MAESDGRARRPGLEAALVYGVTVVVTVVLTRLQSALPWFQGYALPLVAAMFLYLPLELLQRRGEDLLQFGLRRQPKAFDFKVFALAAILVFPPYVAGYHFWQIHVSNREFSSAHMHPDRWPQELEDAPESLNPGEISLSLNRETFCLSWRLQPGQQLKARFWGDGDWDPVFGQQHAQLLGDTLEIEGQNAGRVKARQSGSRISLDAEIDGLRVHPQMLRLGASKSEAEVVPYQAERSFFWILNAILVQLLLVALPEEVFYRGYLQTRFDGILGRKRRILGIELNIASLLLTSALFALGHIATIPHPARLAVFFPSLLFGVMRSATGGLFASVCFHASCNLLVEFAALFYA